MAIKNPATSSQKESFINKFEEIINHNEKLKGNYRIQFFDIGLRTNYVFKGPDGKSINILEALSLEEGEKYRSLKSDWKD